MEEAKYSELKLNFVNNIHFKIYNSIHTFFYYYNLTFLKLSWCIIKFQSKWILIVNFIINSGDHLYEFSNKQYKFYRSLKLW